ncbi:putative Inositol polyphosphate 5-phosphatase OCRL [Blattamonas nauphoetae]|uniref:Inositol polyphosphate 5-phosphatase OCRL n=1 Tax=Blattamonas nauphoetae TaxID=2049346 RepID=A0ABQ9XPV9_9EUKA|nr:putative Inositol polyphosphate 5-phosphatase OCRL [Blattamonas nauphoetae]
MEGAPPTTSTNFFFGTWNVGTAPPPEDLSDFLCLHHKECGIYAITLQEVVPLKLSNLNKYNKNPDLWNTAILNELGPNYSMYYAKQLFGLTLSVFVHRKLLQFMSNMQETTISCGIFKPVPNKGAIVLSFLFHDRPFCFIASHLTSGRGKNIRRMEDFQRIVKECTFGQSSMSPFPFSNPRLSLFEHDFVFWMGDLNYRLDSAISHSQVEEYLKHQKAFKTKLTKAQDLMQSNTLGAVTQRTYFTSASLTPLSSLLLYDQLLLHRLNKVAFSSFEEMRISFPPTYRYDEGTNTYDTSHKLQVPAWCDRVLFFTADPRVREKRLIVEKEDKEKKELEAAMKNQAKMERRLTRKSRNRASVNLGTDDISLDDDWDMIDPDDSTDTFNSRLSSKDRNSTKSKHDEKDDANSVHASDSSVRTHSPQLSEQDHSANHPHKSNTQSDGNSQKPADAPPTQNTNHPAKPTFTPKKLAVPKNFQISASKDQIPHLSLSSQPSPLHPSPTEKKPNERNSTQNLAITNSLRSSPFMTRPQASPRLPSDSPTPTTSSTASSGPTSPVTPSENKESSSCALTSNQNVVLRPIFSQFNQPLSSTAPTDTPVQFQSAFLPPHLFEGFSFFFITPLLYTSHQHLAISDHRPVSALFALTLFPFTHFDANTAKRNLFCESHFAVEEEKKRDTHPLPRPFHIEALVVDHGLECLNDEVSKVLRKGDEMREKRREWRRSKGRPWEGEDEWRSVWGEEAEEKKREEELRKDEERQRAEEQRQEEDRRKEREQRNKMLSELVETKQSPKPNTLPSPFAPSDAAAPSLDESLDRPRPPPMNMSALLSEISQPTKLRSTQMLIEKHAEEREREEEARRAKWEAEEKERARRAKERLEREMERRREEEEKKAAELVEEEVDAETAQANRVKQLKRQFETGKAQSSIDTRLGLDLARPVQALKLQSEFTEQLSLSLLHRPAGLPEARDIHSRRLLSVADHANPHAVKHKPVGGVGMFSALSVTRRVVMLPTLAPSIRLPRRKLLLSSPLGQCGVWSVDGDVGLGRVVEGVDLRRLEVARRMEERKEKGTEKKAKDAPEKKKKNSVKSGPNKTGTDARKPEMSASMQQSALVLQALLNRKKD